jgi:hypothetical protein
MKTLQIPTELRSSLLERLATLPEEKWLKLCKHPDQRKHWLECRGQFQMVENTLRAYFEGASFPYPDLSESDRAFLQMSVDRAKATSG